MPANPVTDAMRAFVGAPVCKLRRYTKVTARAAYFCEQCKHFSKADVCPFAAAPVPAKQAR